MDKTPLPSQEHPATLQSYVWGFGLSVILTLTAFFVVDQKLFSTHATLATILTLAILQTYVQLILFLHLKKESKPRWKMLTFLFMLSVLLILVLGSVWIMYHLNYNMTSDMMK